MVEEEGELEVGDNENKHGKASNDPPLDEFLKGLPTIKNLKKYSDLSVDQLGTEHSPTLKRLVIRLENEKPFKN